MTEDTHQAPTHASDLDEAPLSGTAPTDPATSAPMGVDLEGLPSLDEPVAGGSLAGEDATGDGDPSIHERQDPDHIGVDWDLTERTRD